MNDKISFLSLRAEAANIDTLPTRLDELAHQPELIPIVAANPATSSETLEKLAGHKEKAIRQAVAGNPNTPARQLLGLAQEFPAEFLSNPVLPLLNLSQPDFIKSLQAASWLQLLRHDRVPSVWLKWIQQGLILPLSSQRREVVGELQFHVAIAGEASRGWEIKARIALQEDTRLLSYLYRVNTQVFLLSLLAFPGLAAQWGVELRAARKELQALVLTYSPELNGNMLALLARNTDLSIRAAVARHPRAPAKVLAKLVENVPDPAIRRAVASNPHISVKLLRRLAGDDDAAVRLAVAHHPHLSLELVETLVLDAEPAVRAAVARHPRLSLEIYHFLAEDAEPTVRAALARNVHAPHETLLALAHDASLEVRVALARNPRLPPEVFTLLFQDRSAQGASFVLFFQDERAQLHRSLASNPRLPLSLLEQLAITPDPSIRQNLAANPRTPPAMLETWVGEAINGHSKSAGGEDPSATPRELDQPSGKSLSVALARNPHATPAMLTTLAEYHTGKAEAMVEVRAAVAAHSRTPVDVLRQLMNHSKPAIRRSLAVNPHTPLDVLKQLLATDDVEVWVRIAHHPAVIGDQRRILIDVLLEKIRQERTASTLPTWFFFQHKELPENHLNEMLSSTFWRDRYLAARHPKTSPEVLAALARDGSRYVRMAARTALIHRARLTKRGRTKKDT